MKTRRKWGRLLLDPMTVRLLFMQLLSRVYMIFWMMAMKLTVIEFQIQITNPSLQEIITN